MGCAGAIHRRVVRRRVPLDAVEHGGLVMQYTELVGKTFLRIEGLEKDSSKVVFTFEDGEQWVMEPSDCGCADVEIEEVVGWSAGDLIGQKVLEFREEEGEEKDDSDRCISSRWTFYIIRTHDGSVTIRWYGASNGYYSTRVDFFRKKPGEDLVSDESPRLPPSMYSSRPSSINLKGARINLKGGS